MTTTTDTPGTTTTQRVSVTVVNGMDPVRIGGRPPADLIPPYIAERLDTFDQLSASLETAHTEAQRLADPELDRRAAAEDADATAQAMIDGKKNTHPTAARDKLAAARQAAADAIATTTRALDLAREALAAVREQAGSTAEWRHVIEGIRADTRKALDQAAHYVAELVRHEALDDWLAHSGNPYNPRTHAHIDDLVPEIRVRGIHRDTIGTVDVVTVLARLRDDIR